MDAALFYMKENRIMPTLLILFGLRFFFYSEDHEPMHVHVQRDNNTAKFDFSGDEVFLVYNHGLSNQDIKKCKENHCRTQRRVLQQTESLLWKITPIWENRKTTSNKMMQNIKDALHLIGGRRLLAIQ